MKRKKLARKIKRKMFADTYDPSCESGYALKKRFQGRGIFSTTSPLNAEAKSLYDPFTNKPF